MEQFISGQRAHSVVDVHLVLRNDGRVLLSRRSGTGFMDGLLHLPAGHLEPGEAACSTAAREAREELGLVLEPDDLELVHVIHQCTDASRVGLFFSVDVEAADVHNCEPRKCSELRWADWDDLPSDMVPYAAAALAHIHHGARYSAAGWTVEVA